MIDRIKNKIKESILEFVKDEIDNLIENFSLDSFYKNQYEDKNIMYKVPYIYKRKINNKSITKNLSFYYFDEIKISLPNLFYFWILLLQNKLKHQKLNGIFDMVYSIIEHFKQVFFTFEIIENVLKEAKHFGNPDIFFVFYYHLSYFISLIKTIGDNLAWIVSLYLNLSIDHHNIDLLDQKFRNKIQSQNKYLSDIIYSNDYFDDFRKLNNYRDILQHRHFIKTMRIFIIEKQTNKLLIPKDPEFMIDKSLRNNNYSTESKVIIAEDIKSAIHNGLHEYFITSENNINAEYLDPLEFCNHNLNGISILTENVINRILIEVKRKYIGIIKHFYPKKLVAVANILNNLKLNDYVLIEGNLTSFKQTIIDLEVNLEKVNSIRNGEVGIKLFDKVRNNDKIYTIPKIDNNTFLEFTY